jgi:hypothetical protein
MNSYQMVLHRPVETARESGKLEFKESFNFASIDDYAKTAAAFANSQGGYIVFGVRDNPRDAVGLKGSNFVNLDVAKLTQSLNDRFSPEIAWEAHTHVIGEKIFGILYFAEAPVKPILCTRNGVAIKEGDIYYRYRGQSQRIKYPELRGILEGQAAKERQLWMQYLQKMSKIGIQNVAVLDTLSGELSAQGNTFLIPESLIPKLNVVTSGFLSTETGSPTLRLLGDASVISSDVLQSHLRIPSSIGEAEIIEAFLYGADVISPIEYLRRICDEKSPNLPIYFFITQLRLSLNEITDDLNAVVARGPNKAKLLERLKTPESPFKFCMSSVVAKSLAADERRTLLEKLKSQNITAVDLGGNIARFCEALTHLGEGDISRDYLSNLLSSYVMPKFQHLSAPELTAFRKSLCYLDLLWFKPSLTRTA